MFESIKLAWINLEAVGFYPWVSIVALGVYFLVRTIMGKDKGAAVPWVMGGCALGQLYYAFPKTIEAGIGVLFFALLQTVVSIGVYSFAEYVGIVDVLAKAFKKKVDEKLGDSPTPEPKP